MQVKCTEENMHGHQQIQRFPFLLTAIFLFAAYLQWQLPLNFDVSWFLNITHRFLAGGVYVKDFFENNPPLILYLYAPPVLLAKLFSVNVIVIFQAYIFLLITLSLFFCYWSIQKIFTHKNAVSVVMAALALALSILPVYEFGQREHLLIIFSMPYFCLMAARLEKSEVTYSRALSIGIFAGLGFSLKPFFLLPFAFLEIFFICYQRNFFAWYRAEVLAIILVQVCYVLVVFVFHSDYIFVIVPYALRFYHHGYGYPLLDVLQYPPALFSCLIFLFFSMRLRSQSILLITLWVALGGLLATYFTQHTILYSHVLPAFSLSCILLVLFFMEFVTTIKTHKQDYVAAGALGLCCLAFLIYKVMALWTILIFQPAIFYSFFIVIFGGLLYYLQDKKNLYKVFLSLVIIFPISILFAYWAAHTSWYVHRFSLTLLLLIMLFGVCASQDKKSQPQNIFIVILACLIFAPPAYFVNRGYADAVAYKADIAPLVSFLHQNAAGQSVYFFATTSVYQFPAVSYAQAIPVGRTSFQSWLPGFLPNRQESPEDNALFINMIIEDLNNKKPVYVFVDVSKNKSNLNGLAFEYLSYFNDSLKFQPAWGGYRYFATIDKPPLYRFDVYKLTLANAKEK